jgi:hypothetical protein
MQRDFHYYCIAVLARGAGFSGPDALHIAYASQYVDDATEGDRIRLDLGHDGFKFDPVHTSYRGLEAVQSLAWSAQKQVWIPFHFIPFRPFETAQAESFSFIAGPDGPFARLLLNEAAAEPLQNRKRRLCRIGIALHTCADSWAHQGFSGRQNREDNNVESIAIYHPSTQRWEKLGIENVLFDVLPQVGHAEAGHFPDLAFEHWRCVLGAAQPRPLERDNPTLFLEAARTLYEQLAAMEKAEAAAPIPWTELEPRIAGLLAKRGRRPGYRDRFTLPTYRAFEASEVEQRCDAWRKEFGGLFAPHSEAYAYEREAWRREAIEGDTAWDDYSEADWALMLPRQVRRNFWDSNWVHFHRAALRQQHLVLESLP